ncbi:helix-turn-helix transcriptional regulator [Capsulimonas corticalis]|uniref:helix-turn-helix transcriptional regulator n=1 Tax=Capsulimonas corticalis TaxID=2219043 RepID=UPI001403F914|nr:AraC family transcriptional regulator [Capsulimonas corticalis]
MLTKSDQDSITAWRLPTIVLELHRSTSGRPKQSPRHVHEEYQIIFGHQGAGKYDYRGARHITPPGSLIIIHPGEAHSACGLEARTRTSTYQSIYVQPEYMQEMAVEAGCSGTGLPFFTETVTLDESLIRRFSHLCRALQQSGACLEKASLLCSTIQYLITRQGEIQPAPRKAYRAQASVDRVREYLNANACENVTLADLAGIADLSPNHLCSSFRREIGVPPHAYQTQLRLTKAKSLLADGLPIGDVAAETGFVDQSHLTHQFQRHFGVTPGCYFPRITSAKS